MHGRQNERTAHAIKHAHFSGLRRCRLRLINLEERLGVRALDYELVNSLVLNASFWGLVRSAAGPHATHVLQFQPDSASCGIPSAAALLSSLREYDFCGAPWPHMGVGNNGFSLQRIARFAQLAEAHGDAYQALTHSLRGSRRPLRTDKIIHMLCRGSFAGGDSMVRVAQQLRERGVGGIPARGDRLRDAGCKLCPVRVAVGFAVETVTHPSPFGFHKPWGSASGRSWMRNESIACSAVARRVKALLGAAAMTRAN